MLKCPKKSHYKFVVMIRIFINKFSYCFSAHKKKLLFIVEFINNNFYFNTKYKVIFILYVYLVQVAISHDDSLRLKCVVHVSEICKVNFLLDAIKVKLDHEKWCFSL